MMLTSFTEATIPNQKILILNSVLFVVVVMFSFSNVLLESSHNLYHRFLEFPSQPSLALSWLIFLTAIKTTHSHSLYLVINEQTNDHMLVPQQIKVTIVRMYLQQMRIQFVEEQRQLVEPQQLKLRTGRTYNTILICISYQQ